MTRWARTRWTTRVIRALVGALVLPLVLSGLASGQGAGVRVELDGRPRLGTGSRVRIEMKARGLFRPGLPPTAGGSAAKMPKPLMLDVASRLIFSERAVLVGRDGRLVDARNAKARGPGASASGGSPRVLRQVVQAASVINGEIRPSEATIRPSMTRLVADRPDPAGPALVASLGGPLTRAELELVEGLGDPLTLADLLPDKAVGQGDRYKVRVAGAMAISGYDEVSATTLEGVVESLSGRSCRIKISGRIEGRALGGTGTMTCDGFLTYDRERGWMDRLEINRVEARQPGPIEAGLEVKSTLTLSRQAENPPATLSDAGLAGISLVITPARLLLRQAGPGDACSILHDRRWHLFWEDPKVVVLKKLEGGRVTAQLNLTRAGGRGRLEPAQFRDDLRKVLKDRFGRLIGEGDVGGDPAGGVRYKIGVEGREGDLAVVWYYYLATSLGGDQMFALFTLAAASAVDFGGQDEAIMGSLKWESPERRPNVGAATAPTPPRQ